MGHVDWDQLPLSRATTARRAERRTEPEVVATVLSEPGTLVLLVHRKTLAVIAGDRPDRELALVEAAEVVGLTGAASGAAGSASAQDQRPTWLYLGADDDRGYVACVLPDAAGSGDLGLEGVAPVSPADAVVSQHSWGSLRELGAHLSTRDVGLATEAVALAAWHAAHPRCPRCGEPTEPVDGGWVRRCTNDGSDHYPRTDPAVIMAVLDEDDRMLLGHAAQWPESRYSTLAGYVEPGEPLEAAVRREVLEEVGITVGAVEYRGSQPWPFPASLMLGFVGRALTTDIEVDGVEVTKARWFTRTEIVEAIDSGELGLPSRASIARALIEDWYGGELPGA